MLILFRIVQGFQKYIWLVYQTSPEMGIFFKSWRGVHCNLISERLNSVAYFKFLARFFATCSNIKIYNRRSKNFQPYTRNYALNASLSIRHFLARIKKCMRRNFSPEEKYLWKNDKKKIEKKKRFLKAFLLNNRFSWNFFR